MLAKNGSCVIASLTSFGLDYLKLRQILLEDSRTNNRPFLQARNARSSTDEERRIGHFASVTVLLLMNSR